MSYGVTSVVTGAASTYDLVTLAIVKDELNITVSTFDAKLTRYIKSASSAIALYCRRVFPQETLADHFFRDRVQRQGSPEPLLQAARFPVISVTSLLVDGTALVVGTDSRSDLPTGHIYRVDSDTHHDLVWGCFPIDMIYVAGYATIPDDVQDAAVRLVRARWYAKDRDPLAKSEDVPGVRSVTWWVPTGDEAGNLPPDVADILQPYVVPRRLA